MANNRIFYAVQAVKVRPCITTNGATTYGNERILRGVQSVGMTTNFNLEQIYQLGQLELYDNVEEVPDIEVTMTKALDNKQLIYNAVNDGSTLGSSNNLGLTEIANRRADVALGIWDDAKAGAVSGADYWVVCTGMYVSSVTYNFVTDGNFTEDVTMVGNHKKWAVGGVGVGGITAFSSGLFTNANYTPESARIAKRWALSSESIVPKQVLGVAATGGATLSSVQQSGVRINSITVSCNLGREQINELGRRSPYYRYINFPVEVTSEVELTATRGDNVDADDFGTATGCSAAASGNVLDGSLKVFVCNTSVADGSVAYMIDIGDKNKLTSVNYTGGDTGGGNATMTYSFQTWNTLKVSGVTG